MPSGAPLESDAILPLEYREVSEPPVSFWRSAAGAILGAIVGAGIALGAIAAMGLRHAPRVQQSLGPLAVARATASTVLALLGIWVAVILVHELAHALVGRMGGLRLVQISVGPLRLSRGPNNGWRVGVTRGPQRFTGFVAVVPSRWPGSRRLCRAWTWMIAAGPGVNLVCAVVLLGLLPMLRGWHVRPAITELLAFAALVSLFIGSLSLLPSRSWAGGVSDGEQLRRLRHREPNEQPAGETFSAVVMLGTTAHRLRPRAWDADALTLARRGSSDLPTAFAAHGLLYYHALDSGALGDARRHLQTLIDLAATAPLPSGIMQSGFGRLYVRGRADLAITAATFEAAWRGDAAAASAWLARSTKRSRGALGTYGLEIAHAAIAWALGDLAARDAALTKAASIAATGEFAAATLINAATLERIAGDAG